MSNTPLDASSYLSFIRHCIVCDNGEHDQIIHVTSTNNHLIPQVNNSQKFIKQNKRIEAIDYEDLFHWSV